MELTIECQKRTPGSKPKALRREGLIPAALYGHKGPESVSLTVNAKMAELLVKKASVNNTLVQVKIPDIRWSGKALLREVQSHPWKGSLYHLSFFSVAAQDSLDISVPLSFVGESPAVKQGGSLDTVLTELQVQCAPDNIPESIEIDVSQMDVGDTLYVHQLVLPSGITVLGDPERVVVSALPPRITAEEEEAAEAAEMETIEEEAAEKMAAEPVSESPAE